MLSFQVCASVIVTPKCVVVYSSREAYSTWKVHHCISGETIDVAARHIKECVDD